MQQQHPSSARSDAIVKSESPDLSNSSAGSTPLFAPQPHSPSLHYDASATAAAAAAGAASSMAAGTGSGRGNSPSLRFHEQMSLGSASPPQRPARSAALQAQARQAARIKAEKEEEEEEEDEEGEEEEDEEEESEVPTVRSPASRSSTSGRSLMSSSRAPPAGDSSAAAAASKRDSVSSPVITGTGCGPIINGVRSKRGQGVSCHSCKTSKDSHALIYCQNKGEKGVKKRRCRKKVSMRNQVAAKHFVERATGDDTQSVPPMSLRAHVAWLLCVVVCCCCLLLVSTARRVSSAPTRRVCRRPQRCPHGCAPGACLALETT